MRKLKVCPSQEYVYLLLFEGSFCRHWTAMVLKFPVYCVCSAKTTVPLATKLYIKPLWFISNLQQIPPREGTKNYSNTWIPQQPIQDVNNEKSITKTRVLQSQFESTDLTGSKCQIQSKSEPKPNLIQFKIQWSQEKSRFTIREGGCISAYTFWICQKSKLKNSCQIPNFIGHRWKWGKRRVSNPVI